MQVTTLCKCSCCGIEKESNQFLYPNTVPVCESCDNTSKFFSNAEPTVKDKRDCITVVDNMRLNKLESIVSDNILKQIEIDKKLNELMDLHVSGSEAIKGLRMVIIEMQKQIEEMNK